MQPDPKVMRFLDNVVDDTASDMHLEVLGTKAPVKRIRELIHQDGLLAAKAYASVEQFYQGLKAINPSSAYFD